MIINYDDEDNVFLIFYSNPGVHIASRNGSAIECDYEIEPLRLINERRRISPRKRGCYQETFSRMKTKSR